VHVAAGIQLRGGAEYFTAPRGAGQRRYEALRAYLVDEATAAQVADRFGYSTASVHQMATLLRTGKLDPFGESKPGPKGPHKATGEVRDKVLALRAEDRSSARSPHRWPPRARRSPRRRYGRSSTTPDCPGWPAATRAAAAPRRGWSRSRRPPWAVGPPPRRSRVTTPDCCCCSR